MIKIPQQGTQVRVKTQRDRAERPVELSNLFRVDAINLAKEINPNNSDVINLGQNIVTGLQVIENKKDELTLKQLELDAETDDQKKIIDIYTQNKNNPNKIYSDIKKWIDDTSHNLTRADNAPYRDKYSSDKRFKEKADLILANRERNILKQTRQHFIDEVEKDSIIMYKKTNEQILDVITKSNFKGPALYNQLFDLLVKFVQNEESGNPNPLKVAEEIQNARTVALITVAKNSLDTPLTIYGEVDYTALYNFLAEDSSGSFIVNGKEIKFTGSLEYIHKRLGLAKKDELFTKEDKTTALEFLRKEGKKQKKQDNTRNNKHNTDLASEIFTLANDGKWVEANQLLYDPDPNTGLRGDVQAVASVQKNIKKTLDDMQEKKFSSPLAISIRSHIENQAVSSTANLNTVNMKFEITSEILIEEINAWLLSQKIDKQYSTDKPVTVYELLQDGLLTPMGFKKLSAFFDSSPEVKQRVDSTRKLIDDRVKNQINIIKGDYVENNPVVLEAITLFELHVQEVIDEFLLKGTANGKRVTASEFLDASNPKTFFGGFQFDKYIPDAENADSVEFETLAKAKEEIGVDPRQILRERISLDIDAGGKFNFASFVAKPEIQAKSPYYDYKKANKYIKENPGKFVPKFDEISQQWSFPSFIQETSGVYELLRKRPKKQADKEYTEKDKKAIASWKEAINKEVNNGAVIVETDDGKILALYRGLVDENTLKKYEKQFYSTNPKDDSLFKEDPAKVLKRQAEIVRKQMEYDDIYTSELEDFVQGVFNLWRPKEWKKEFKKDEEILEMLLEMEQLVNQGKR